MLNDYIFPLPCLIFLPQVAYLLQGYDLLIDQSPSDIRRAGLNKVIPKHLEQEIKNIFDWYIRAACVNTAQ